MKTKTIILLAIATILACNPVTAQSEKTNRAYDSIRNFKENAADQSITFNPDLTYGEVKDVDGNVYKTITIGTQTWMAENLKTTHYNDTTAIPIVIGETAWAALTTSAYCWYNNDSAANKAAYGALYNWHAVNTGTLAPIGWHVPTDAEWTTLENYLIANGYNYDGTSTGNKYAKALASDTGWESSTNVGAVGNTDYITKRNSTGFTALPGGTIDYYGLFIHLGNGSYFWSSSANFGYYAYGRGLRSDNSIVLRYSFWKSYGFSVRCVKDSVSTTDVNLIESKGSSSVKLYPNPVINQLQINYKSTEPGKVQIEIIGLHGKVFEKQILNSQIGTNHATISVTHLPAGLYLLRFQSNNKLETIKLIKY